MAVVVDKDLSGSALFLEDTFSGVHEEIVIDTFGAKSGFSAVDFTEFADLVAEVVVAQILSFGTLARGFKLEADSVC